jgi:hypothetical protein
MHTAQVVGNHFINYLKQQEMASFLVSDTKFHNRYTQYTTETVIHFNWK